MGFGRNAITLGTDPARPGHNQGPIVTRMRKRKAKQVVEA